MSGAPPNTANLMEVLERARIDANLHSGEQR
jgi:hypothetical protein